MISQYLIHLWIGFLLISSGACLEGCRRLDRRYRIARGDRR